MVMSSELRDLKQAVRNVYAWPGGYEMHLVMADGGEICMQCARKEWQYIYAATKNPGTDKQWEALGAEVYWEGPPMECDHCNRPMASAYGDPEEEEL